MSKKQIRKIHIGDKVFLYTINSQKHIQPNPTWVNVYESGNKSDILFQLEYPEYIKVTPSMVKEGILKQKTKMRKIEIILTDEQYDKLKNTSDELKHNGEFKTSSWGGLIDELKNKNVESDIGDVKWRYNHYDILEEESWNDMFW